MSGERVCVPECVCEFLCVCIGLCVCACVIAGVIFMTVKCVWFC